MKDLIRFFFELGRLKTEDRTGWKYISIPDAETVAGHSFRAALIGYIMAKIDGSADPERIMKMLLFHDVPETRIGDIDMVAANYLDKARGEKKVIEEQSKDLPDEIAGEYRELMEEFESRDSRAALIAKDADLLECSLQAKEYMEKDKRASEWLENTGKSLRTEIGKEIWAAVKETDKPRWEGLKKFDR